jgi:16S rRNA (guanine966-N2)-methyltransferase
VRIIAGSHKGARLWSPTGRDTRPTPDRVREAAFSLIGPVDGAHVLDLYAGSGAMGLEALSRGAALAVFVESDLRPLRTIARNVEKLGVEGAELVRADAPARVGREAREGRRYDLVLIDPPYRMLRRELARLAPDLPSILSANALVLVESAAADEPQLPLVVRSSRRYGSTRLTLFEAP